MKEKHSFLMPDYYPSFACKMGVCRSACCVGWPIQFSLDDYFHLENLDCSPALRDRLDRGIHICLQPTQDEYAQFTPRFDGNCYMRLEDGRCALHAELGEDALTPVCRLYPRGVRFKDEYEISCSNSCEATVELLMHHDAPLSFIRRELEIELPKLPERQTVFSTMGQEEAIRLRLLACLQNRDFPLARRFLILKDLMIRMENAMNRGEEETLRRLCENSPEDIPAMPEILPENLRLGIRTMEKILELLDENSTSIREYGQDALSFYGTPEEAYANYLYARIKFETAFPKWEIIFENLIVNHMFFCDFPFQDRPESLTDEFTALSVLYALLRFLCIGWVAHHASETDLADVCAAAFRLIDHTDFEQRSIHLLRQIHTDHLSDLNQWIIL